MKINLDEKEVYMLILILNSEIKSVQDSFKNLEDRITMLENIKKRLQNVE